MCDDHFEEEGEIIARKTIKDSIDHGDTYRIMQDDNPVGGIVIRVGGGAIAAMAESNIKVYAGASGKADEVTSWDTRISVRPWISTQKRRMRAWKRRWTSWQGYYVECIV